MSEGQEKRWTYEELIHGLQTAANMLASIINARTDLPPKTLDALDIAADVCYHTAIELNNELELTKLEDELEERGEG